jgi:hypothetical protein
MANLAIAIAGRAVAMAASAAVGGAVLMSAATKSMEEDKEYVAIRDAFPQYDSDDDVVPRDIPDMDKELAFTDELNKRKAVATAEAGGNKIEPPAIYYHYCNEVQYTQILSERSLKAGAEVTREHRPKAAKSRERDYLVEIMFCDPASQLRVDGSKTVTAKDVKFGFDDRVHVVTWGENRFRKGLGGKVVDWEKLSQKQSQTVVKVAETDAVLVEQPKLALQPLPNPRL